MKIIEGLKQIKDLLRKAEDLRTKVRLHSAHLSFETPVYKDQASQVKAWMQSHSDILKEVLALRLAVQRTNLATIVGIEIDSKIVEKPIAAWIHRRKDLSDLEVIAWKGLTDRGLKEEKMKQSTGEIMEIKIVRCYDPSTRDNQIELLTSEKALIDGRLEIVKCSYRFNTIILILQIEIKTGKRERFPNLPLN